MLSEIARACEVWQSRQTDLEGLETSFLFRLAPCSSRLPDALGSVKLFSLFMPRPHGCLSDWPSTTTCSS